MSAAYRPYRDEDSCDSLNNLEDDVLNWSDEPVSIQIYDKNTEEHDDFSFINNRKYLIAFLALFALSFLSGFLFGFFMHSSHEECVPNYSINLHSIKHEDSDVTSRILELINKNRIEHFIEDFSKQPRIAGSEYDIHLMEKIKEYFIQHSLDQVTIDSCTVLLSLPSNESFVSIIDNNDNKELYSYHWNEFNGSYCAYSLDGDIEGDLVYVNFGNQSDYDKLKENNITVNGKILIAKRLTTESKLLEQVSLAVKHNARSLLLFPDPEFFKTNNTNDLLPKDAFQWCSLAVKGQHACTQHIYDTSTDLQQYFSKIPIQPISLNIASHLLSTLKDKYDESWFYGINRTTYGDTKIKLQIKNKLINQTLHNVIGIIRGKIEPDRIIIIGNKRDSWSYGALESAGGTAAMLEISRVFGELIKQGWRPRRSIMFCSFTGEEFGLIGSTSWIERNRQILESQAIAFINSNNLVSGTKSLDVASSPLLYNVVFNATKLVKDISGKNTIYDNWLSNYPEHSNRFEGGFVSKVSVQKHIHLTEKEIFKTLQLQHPPLSNSTVLKPYLDSIISKKPKIRALDEDGEYILFSNYFGIPVVDVRYSSSFGSSYALKSSQYDTFDMLKKIDKKLDYHLNVVLILGEIIRDLSDSLFIPFNLLYYVQILRNLSAAISKYPTITNSSFFHDLDVLNSAIHNFSQASYEFHYKQDMIDFSDPMSIRRINDQLLLIERSFLFMNNLKQSHKKHIVLSTMNPDPQLQLKFLLNEMDSLSINDSGSLRSFISMLISCISSATNLLKDI